MQYRILNLVLNNELILFFLHLNNFCIIFLFQIKKRLEDTIRREKIPPSTEAIYNFLIDHVRANLHVVLCLSPVGEAFRWPPFFKHTVFLFSHFLLQNFIFLQFGPLGIAFDSTQR